MPRVDIDLSEPWSTVHGSSWRIRVKWIWGNRRADRQRRWLLQQLLPAASIAEGQSHLVTAAFPGSTGVKLMIPSPSFTLTNSFALETNSICRVWVKPGSEALLIGRFSTGLRTTFPELSFAFASRGTSPMSWSSWCKPWSSWNHKYLWPCTDWISRVVQLPTYQRHLTSRQKNTSAFQANVSSL